MFGAEELACKKDSTGGKEYGAYKGITRCVSAAGAERAGGDSTGC